MNQFAQWSWSKKKGKQNDDKNCGWVIVGFSSYFLNSSRSKADLILFSSCIEFSISHVNFYLRYFTVFGFFTFTWMQCRWLARKKYPKYGFRSKIAHWIQCCCQKNLEIFSMLRMQMILQNINVFPFKVLGFFSFIWTF